MKTLNTSYIKIYYEDEKSLKKFNRKLYVKGKVRNKLRKMKLENIKEMVIAKIDIIIDRVMEITGLYPYDDLKSFGITILKDRDGVSEKFKKIYKEDADFIAFYSRSKEMIYYSSKHSKARVVSHEIGHAVAELYFSPNSPSRQLHELIAQYAERYIFD